MQKQETGTLGILKLVQHFDLQVTRMGKETSPMSDKGFNLASTKDLGEDD